MSSENGGGAAAAPPPLSLRDKAAWLLENLLMAHTYRRDLTKYERFKSCHAVHPLTGATLCSWGRRGVLDSPEAAVGSLISCPACLAAIDRLIRIAEGE